MLPDQLEIGMKDIVQPEDADIKLLEEAQTLRNNLEAS